MLQRLKVMVQSIRERFGRPAAEFGSRAADATGAGMARAASGIAGAKVVLVVAGVLASPQFLARSAWPAYRSTHPYQPSNLKGSSSCCNV